MDRILPRLAAALLLLTVPRGLAAQITPVGPGVRADTLTQFDPGCPHLALGPDRSFEIAWSYGPFSVDATFGRHFSPGGAPSSGEQIQIGPGGGPFHLVMADRLTALPDGFQLLLEQTHSTQPPDTLRQQLDLNGDPVGPAELLKIKNQILVGPGGDLYSTFYQHGPKKLGIQRVAADGTSQGPRIFLSSRPIKNSSVTLGVFGDGDFVAGWNGFTADARPRQVLRARLFHDGLPMGQDFDLNTIPSPTGLLGLSQLHLVTGPSSHGFAAVWVAQTGQGPIVTTAIHLRFFDPSGRPRTPEIVAVPSAVRVNLQAAALDAAGNLLLLWNPPSPALLRARLFSATDGAPLGPAYPVVRTDSYTCGDVAWAGDSWLIAYRASSGDDYNGAIVWRRFTE